MKVKIINIRDGFPDYKGPDLTSKEKEDYINSILTVLHYEVGSKNILDIQFNDNEVYITYKQE